MQNQIHALSLHWLLLNYAVAADIVESGSAFSAYDREKLLQLCQSETIYADSPADWLMVTGWRGGYLKGNYCYLTGLLYQDSVEQPVANLEVRFSAYLSGPEIYLQSLKGPFVWSNDFAALRAQKRQREPWAASSKSEVETSGPDADDDLPAAGLAPVSSGQSLWAGETGHRRTNVEPIG